MNKHANEPWLQQQQAGDCLSHSMAHKEQETAV
jgi:hypothetical protein